MTRTDADSWDRRVQRRRDRHDGRRGAGAGQQGAERADRRPVRRAAGAGGRASTSSPAWSTARSGMSDDDGGRPPRLMTNVMAVRTRFFDDFFSHRSARGGRRSGRR